MPVATQPTNLFADRVHRIRSEAAFELVPRIADVEAEGARVIRCNRGQPDFPLPKHTAKAVKAGHRPGGHHLLRPAGYSGAPRGGRRDELVVRAA